MFRWTLKTWQQSHRLAPHLSNSLMLVLSQCRREGPRAGFGLKELLRQPGRLSIAGSLFLKSSGASGTSPCTPGGTLGGVLVSSSHPATVTLLLISLPREKISEKKYYQKNYPRENYQMLSVGMCRVCPGALSMHPCACSRVCTAGALQGAAAQCCHGPRDALSSPRTRPSAPDLTKTLLSCAHFLQNCYLG